MKEFELVESNVTLNLKNEKQNNKESERKVLSMIEGKIDNLRNEFTNERRQIEDIKEEQSQKITEQIANLQHGIKQERAIREETQETIIKKFTGKLTEIKETIRRERKVCNLDVSLLNCNRFEMKLRISYSIRSKRLIIAFIIKQS